MKKLIAISVVFALIAGAAFAQPSVGGSLGAKIVLIKSTSEEDAPLLGGISFNNRYVNVRYQNDAGTAGGMVRLSGTSDQVGWWGGLPFAFGWWKPIPQLRIQIGHNPDGDFGSAQISGWGFNQEAQDSVAIDQDSGDSSATGWKAARRAGFYGGFSDQGVTLSITPTSGLAVNLVLPFGNGRGNSVDTGVGEIYPKIHLNVVGTIPDIGVVRFTFQGKGGLDSENHKEDASVGDLFASFYLTAIDGLGVDLGVAFGIPYKDAADKNNNGTGMSVGLGVRYGAGDFGVKLRVGTQLMREAADVKSPTTIGVVVLPSYKLPVFTAYLNAGFGITIPDGDGDSVVDWMVNPYIVKPVGAFTLYVGFKLWSDGGDDAITKWGLPVGFNAYF